MHHVELRRRQHGHDRQPEGDVKGAVDNGGGGVLPRLPQRKVHDVERRHVDQRLHHQPDEAE
eukprot:CAMPEP_0185339038 /NCGR_PEP_ID=MMETSP1363-20130426/97309_1 /TAXON_ID=38817 /ORGANISM="Gephyrocapsa oceanica, Strain RCC1303" /LENGTH=61 /DNA_ID=CAMNT_0027938257 /DNA_START=41 /DNA_END=226 /DNA_ORIENTATION=-